MFTLDFTIFSLENLYFSLLTSEYLSLKCYLFQSIGFLCKRRKKQTKNEFWEVFIIGEAGFIIKNRRIHKYKDFKTQIVVLSSQWALVKTGTSTHCITVKCFSCPIVKVDWFVTKTVKKISVFLKISRRTAMIATSSDLNYSASYI